VYFEASVSGEKNYFSGVGMMTKVLRKVLLVPILMFPGIAFPSWTLHIDSDATKTQWFYDAGSRPFIPKNQLWIKAEHRVPVKEMRSSRTLLEFDCNNMRLRYNMYSAYDQNNLQGKTLYSTAVPDNWEPIPPYTTHHEFYKIVCGK